MTKRSFIVLIALLAVLGLVIWTVSRNDKTNQQAGSTPLLSVYAFNQTKNVAATQTAAAPGDIIIYTMSAENQTDKVVPGFIVEANIAEVTDKSTLIDATGASFNSATNSLVWTPIDIPPKGLIQKQFSVRVNPVSSASANTVMKINFNNELVISVQPASPPKVAGVNTNENSGKGGILPSSPVTGPAGSLSFWLAALTTAALLGIKRYRISKI